MAKKKGWSPIDSGVPIGVELIVYGPKTGVYTHFVVLNQELDNDGNELGVVYDASNGKPVPEHVVNDVTHWMYAPEAPKK